MHKVRVPILKRYLNDAKRKCLIAKLHEANIDSVYLITEWNLTNPKEYQRELDELKENIPIFEEEGFEVAVWIGSTIGHGAPLAGETYKDRNSYREWVSILGNVAEGNFCPADEIFSSAVAKWLQDVVRVGGKILLLDDDFRMTVRGDSLGCLCDWHLAEFNRMVGEQLTREEVCQKVFTGPKNRYRDAWMTLSGDTMRNFTRKLRQAVDEVDDTVRMGMCTTGCHWGMEGVDAIELTHILAGKTKPFTRLGGGPWYGGVDYTILTFGIESERLMQSYFEGEGVETFSELDCYPRPRYACPAAYMEAIDTVLIAEGKIHGSLKYMVDYGASSDYEMGYLNAHRNNLTLYQDLERCFFNKNTVGLNIFEVPNKHRDIEWPEDFVEYNRNLGLNKFPGAGVRWMRNLSIPLTYGDTSVASVVFNDDALYVTEDMKKRGMVLNMRSAYLLKQQGIDVGYTELSYAGIAQKEHYLEEDETIIITDKTGIYELKHQPGARLLTEFMIEDKIVPGVYEYQNADGGRYVVLPFWDYNAPEPKTWLSGYHYSSSWKTEDPKDNLMKNYCRQRQMIKSVEWLNQKPLDAVCPGHPYLYMLVKKDSDSMTVGMWNLSPDKIIAPMVTLGEEYQELEVLQCEATLEGKEVRLTSTIQPFECAAIVLKKKQINTPIEGGGECEI